jgi:hypothetical protein
MRASSRTRPYRYETVEFQGSVTLHRGLWPLAVLVGIALAALLAYVGLRSATEVQQRQLSQLRKEYGISSKEAENLGIELESYKSGSYVLSAVNRLGLGLRPPYPGQVRRVSLIPTPAPEKEPYSAGNPFLAQR